MVVILIVQDIALGIMLGVMPVLGNPILTPLQILTQLQILTPRLMCVSDSPPADIAVTMVRLLGLVAVVLIGQTPIALSLPEGPFCANPSFAGAMLVTKYVLPAYFRMLKRTGSTEPWWLCVSSGGCETFQLGLG